MMRRFLLTTLCALWAGTAYAALAVAEAQQGISGSAVTTLATGIFATSPNVGDAIVVCVSTQTASGSTHTAPTDTAGHTATAIGSEQTQVSTNPLQLSTWIFENITTGTGLSSYRVTGHWGSASGTIIAVRVTGNLTPTSYNGDIVTNSLTTEGTAANPSVGPTTVAPAANSLFFGCMASSTTAGTYTDGTGIAWTHVTGETQTNNSTSDDLYVEHFLNTGGSVTKQTATWTGAAASWFARIFSIAPSTGAAVVVPQRTLIGVGT
jgi:hypothetical protein